MKSLLKARITIQKLFDFKSILWSIESSCLRFILLSSLGIYSPKDYLNQGLKNSKRNGWDGNSLLHWCLRGIVDSHFGNYLFCLKNFEQWEYRQSWIQPRLEWYLTFLYFKNRTFFFQPQKIPNAMLKLKILYPKILIDDPEHIFWYLITLESAIHFSFIQSSLYNPKLFIS